MAGIRWFFDTLTPALRAFPAMVDERLEDKAQKWAEEVAEYARSNAPWEDQTGAARSGLAAEVEDLGFLHKAIVLHHGVDYGIWLEVRWNGQYAIIMPTIEVMAPRIMADLNGLIEVRGG